MFYDFIAKTLLFFIEKMREAFAMTLLLKTLLFFSLKKMREAFAMRKLITFFQQKILAYLRY